jgi:4-hydroxy-4-methyl-2-oxoglutarate aldolase
MTIMIRRDFPRADEAAIRPFRGVPSGFVVDANGRRGAADYRLRPIIQPKPFVGTALTVWTVPSDNLTPWAALTVARPGDVLVIATENCETASVIGDVYLGMAKNAGILAVVTDGLVRDLDGMEQVGIPVFARGVSPNSPQKNGPGSIGLPVSVGGLSIDSGDLVVGDRNGVVVVPRRAIDQVARELEKVKAKERDMDAAVAKGAKAPTWIGDYLAKNPPVEIEA